MCAYENAAAGEWRQELFPPLPWNHFRARGKFESLGIWQREREENGRRREEERRKTIEKWNWSGARSHKEINVSGSHTEKEEDDDINPLFLV